jgi:hypothetical protein
MEELFFIPSHRVTPVVVELVEEGNHITLDGLTYQKLSRKPRGRVVRRRLQSTNGDTRILIYS